MAAGMELLDPAQQERVRGWLPDVEVHADLSWPGGDTVVLDATAGGRRVVIKAARPDGRTVLHLARELRAHHEWTGPWLRQERAAALLHGDVMTGVLVTEHLPGRLVLGDPAQDDPDTFRQAGALLAALHRQRRRRDPMFEVIERDRTAARLEEPHRIAPDVVAAVWADLATWATPPVMVVPTHGDWQPRNWLVDDAVVRVFDLGRADRRPAATDLLRLAAQDFRDRPDLEAAFLGGYGTDPRTPGAWHRYRVREAVATAVWAFSVGEAAFERQGHRMIADVLADADGGHPGAE